MDRLDRWTMLKLIGLLIAIVVGGLIARHLWSLRGRRRREHLRYGADRELAELARRFERALARARLPVIPQRTWREHLAAHAGRAEAALARQFVDHYDARRFGGQLAGASPTLRMMVERLEQHLARSEEHDGRG
jgi:hypothetical protein